MDGAFGLAVQYIGMGSLLDLPISGDGNAGYTNTNTMIFFYSYRIAIPIIPPFQ